MSKHGRGGQGGKQPREEEGGQEAAGAATTAVPAGRQHHHDKHQRPPHKHHKKPLAPPPPKPGALAQSLIAGSNWAQLKARLASSAAAEGGEGGGEGGNSNKRRRPNHKHGRPTLNEQWSRGGGAGPADAPAATLKKKEKQQLRPIMALSAAANSTPSSSSAGPLLMGGAAAMAAAAAAASKGHHRGAVAAAAAVAAVGGGEGGVVAATPTATALTLTPTAPPTQVLAIDCEMVGVGPEGKRSALARVCLINAQGEVVLDTFCKPKERVTDYRTWVSGVRESDLVGAPELEAVQRRVAELVAGRVLVGHSIAGDLSALLLSHPRRLIRDTARYPPLMRRASRAPEGLQGTSMAADIARGKRRPKALRVLAAQELGLDIQSGEHTPVDDARAALYLYLHHAREWERAIRRGDVARLPVGVSGGAAAVQAAVAAARQRREAKGAGVAGVKKGGGARARGHNTLDVRELAKSDPFADL